MPFTLAHPAAIIPLRRLRYFALLPLIVGSMVPDVLSFLPYRFRWLLPDSHSLKGLPTTDLVIGYGLLIIIVLIRQQLMAPLWGSHRLLVQTAFDRFLAQRLCWLTAALALLLGAFTHLLWDNFTHADRWMVRAMPALQQPLFPDSEHPLVIFHALQYISSVVGLLVIAWCYWRARRGVVAVLDANHASHNKRRYLLLAMIVLSLVAGGVFASNLPREFISTYSFLATSLRIALVCFALLYLCAGAVLYANERWNRQAV